MATNIGKVEFIVGADGKILGTDLRRIGKQAGVAGGKEISKGVETELRSNSGRIARALNDSLTLDRSVLSRNRADVANFTSSTRGEFRRMSADTRAALADMFPDLSANIDRIRDSMRGMKTDFIDRAGASFRRLVNDTKTVDKSFQNLNIHWRDLSYNTRQWTLIIGTVAAAMVDLSVLASATGAGIMGLGGVLSTAALGAGALITSFSVLGKDLKDLPASLQGTKIQFDKFKDTMKELRFQMADAAFQKMPGAFDRLGQTVNLLMPDLRGLSGAVGKVFDNFTKGIANGTDAFGELRFAIQNAEDDIGPLASATGTWTTALLRGFNKANPLADQMVGYIDKLGKRFDAFTRSSAFEVWVKTSMGTFTEFGKLLDATGRMLNNLVTPESASRTQNFLRDLTGFMPALGGLLDILGKLNLFGLAAQLLNDFGRALSPLIEPLGRLAESLSGVASVLIESLAGALEVVVPILAVLADSLANVINAVPPEALSALATGFTVLGGAFLALKGAQGAIGALNDMLLLKDGMYGVLNITGKLETGLGNLGGILRTVLTRAGWVGLAITGVFVLQDAIIALVREMKGIPEAARNIVNTGGTIANASKKIGDNLSNISVGGNDVKETFKAMIAQAQGMDKIPGIVEGNYSSMTEMTSRVASLRDTFKELDQPLADLAQKNLPEAQKRFQAWANEMGGGIEGAKFLLKQFPELSSAFKDVAIQTTGAGTATDILNVALGGISSGTATGAEALKSIEISAAGAAGSTERLTGALDALATQELISRDAHRGFEAATDDLSASIAQNGATLDTTTAAGRANESAIDALVNATNKWSNETLNQTGSQTEANKVIADGRDRLIDMLGQLGITGQAADDYADKLGLIPKDVYTDAQLRGISGVESTLNWTARDRTAKIYAEMEAAGGGPTYWGQGGHMATGGVLNGPRRILAGESGAEAIVPLQRPLGAVDPSVRWLSAIAQGKTPAFASGGIVGGASKTVIFQPGSIVVQGAQDPRRAALETADEIALRIGS